jgi:DNA modification methylase
MGVSILVGDCRDVLRTLPDQSVQCIVTSPPYFGLRDYGVDSQIGLEATPDEFVAELVAVFHEARRVLREDGTLWLNLGDSYAGSGRGIGDTKTDNKGQPASRDMHDAMVASGAIGRAWVKPPPGLKQKDLIGIPWRVAFALQADGWYLRQDIIWHKPNPMPESVTDRCTKAHEYVFLLAKSARYHYDAGSIAEPAVYAESGRESATKADLSANRKRNGKDGSPESFRAITELRNRRSVWSITTQPYSEAHFATMAPELAETCIKAGCPAGGTVLDPFGGAGTSGLVADRLGRNAILIELNPEYAALARNRISDDAGMFGAVA